MTEEPEVMPMPMPAAVAGSEADPEFRGGLPSNMKMSPGLAVFFNTALLERCKLIAGYMSKADGMMPRHLIGKPEACFAVLSRSLVWNLDPYAVAMATYQTPGGSIGYMGALIQAILENSGRIDGPIKFTHEGDWTKVRNKFKKEKGQRGGEYPVPTWTPEDAAGLSVLVSAQLKGETEPRTLRVDLNECWPLNSPLWATAPNRQICYLAVRAFANLVVPSLMYGVPFDVDPVGFYGEPMENITPQRPTKPSPFDRGAIAGNKTDEPAPEATNGGGEQQHTHESGTGSEQNQNTEGTEQQGDDQQGAAAWLAQQYDNLGKCIRVADVADLRKSVEESEPSAEDRKNWEAACDARTRQILAATSTKPQAGKKK